MDFNGAAEQSCAPSRGGVHLTGSLTLHRRSREAKSPSLIEAATVRAVRQATRPIPIVFSVTGASFIADRLGILKPLRRMAGRRALGERNGRYVARPARRRCGARGEKWLMFGSTRMASGSAVLRAKARERARIIPKGMRRTGSARSRNP